MALMRTTLSAFARSRFGGNAVPKFSSLKPRDNMVNMGAIVIY